MTQSILYFDKKDPTSKLLVDITINSSAVLGCHSLTITVPQCLGASYDLVSGVPCNHNLEYFHKAGLVDKNLTNIRAVAFLTTYVSKEFSEWLKGEVFEVLSASLGNAGIYAFSDNVNNYANLVIKPSDFVKFLMVKKGWGCWSSPIINNPNYASGTVPHFCQLWFMVKDSKNILADSSFVKLPEGPIETREATLGRYVGRQTDKISPTTKMYVRCKVTQEDIERGWDMFDGMEGLIKELTPTTPTPAIKAPPPIPSTIPATPAQTFFGGPNATNALQTAAHNQMAANQQGHQQGVGARAGNAMQGAQPVSQEDLARYVYGRRT